MRLASTGSKFWQRYEQIGQEDYVDFGKMQDQLLACHRMNSVLGEDEWLLIHIYTKQSTRQTP
jgi:hypothetical protein